MSRKILAMAALGAVLVLGACGDDNGPNGDTLTAQEQAALIQALSTKAIAPAALSAGLSSLFSQATVGTMGDFAAVGSQLKITVTDGSTSTTTVYNSVTGWAGLDAAAKTVDSAITVASFIDGASTFPPTINADLATDGYAAYFDGTTTFNESATGALQVTSTSFGSTQNCPNIPAQSGITSCRVAVGTMVGNFDFAVEDASSNPYTRGNTSFNVPAVQLSITVNASTQP
jgi:hypothetical protein